MKKTLIALTCILLLSYSMTRATTWTTAAAGYWLNPSTWQGGIVPPMASADTFEVLHAVAIDAPFTLLSSGRFHIAQNGGICGHETFTQLSNSYVQVDGLLELDRFTQSGGHLELNGWLILTNMFSGSNGGTSVINGGMAIGIWFECEMPLYNFTAVEHEVGADFTVAPNPSSGRFTFSGPQLDGDGFLDIFDIHLRKVRVETLPAGSALPYQLSVEELPQGLYYWQIRTENTLLGQGKIEIIK